MLQKSLHIGIGLLIVAAFAVLGLRLYFVYVASPNLGAMESSVVYGLQRILADFSLYSDPEKAPFAIIQYSPLYYELVGGVGRILAVDPDVPLQVYHLNRWAGLLFNLLGLLILGSILKPLRLPGLWKGGLLVLAWLCLEPAHYARPDSLEALFFLLFVGASLQYEKQQTPFLILLMSLAAVLACWSKQNGIVLTLFLLFYLFFLKKKWRHGLGALMLMLLFSLFLWGMLIPDTQLFLANVVRGVDNGISLPFFFSAIYDAGFKKFFPFFLLGFYLSFIWLFFPGSPTQKLLGWLLAASAAFAFGTALKWGSIPSYFTDFVHLSLIGFAYALAESPFSAGENFSVKQKLFLGLALVLFIPLHTSGKEWGRVMKEGKSDVFQQAESIRQKITDENISEEEFIFTHDFLINLYLFRHCLFPQNDIVYCCAAPPKNI